MSRCNQTNLYSIHVCAPLEVKWTTPYNVSLEKNSFQVRTIHISQWDCNFSECHKEASNTFLDIPVGLGQALTQKLFNGVAVYLTHFRPSCELVYFKGHIFED